MPDQSTSDELLVRYLLDQVSDEERTQVEERFVADESFYRHLLLIEEELRSAYASGALPAEERRQFEKRFLIFEDEREKVEFEQALIAELSTADVPHHSVPPVAVRETRGWRERLLGFGPWPAAARLAAAAAAIVVALLSWQVYEGRRLRSQLSELEAARAAREQETAQQARADRSRLDQIARDLEDARKARALLESELARQREPASTAGIVALVLTPGRLRAGGEARTTTVPQGAGQVRLVLLVDPQAAFRGYQAEILNADGVRVWSRPDLPAGPRVVLTVPGTVLAEDDYEIGLKGITATGALERAGDYYFTVLK